MRLPAVTGADLIRIRYIWTNGRKFWRYLTAKTVSSGRRPGGQFTVWDCGIVQFISLFLTLPANYICSCAGSIRTRYPRHWDTSAAGHVSPGESYAAAAARELAEELRLQEKLAPVAEVPACPETGWEHVVLFQCRTETAPEPNPEEIELGAFYSLEEIEQMLADASLPITPAFRLLYNLWKSL